ncbi:MAG TPA: transposase [Xanthobacteraceae bacterium]|nr:transposase [Xanthobacteraceae bacterium]
MSTKKRHTDAEIAAKLQQADALAADGSRQSEIVRSLGISVMTLHRWRKARPPQTVTTSRVVSLASFRRSDWQRSASELQIENARLRRLVTDLLLEKLRLEDEVQGRHLPPRRA